LSEFSGAGVGGEMWEMGGEFDEAAREFLDAEHFADFVASATQLRHPH
jgi:hypothetical protein